jgi:hypothetical protein
MLKPFEVKPWKAQATNPYNKGLQSVVLVCPKNESQGQESQGRTDNNNFVCWVHDVKPF